MSLRRISAAEPLPFDTAAFWLSRPIEDLAQQQGVAPATFESPFAQWTEQELADIASALADLNT